MRLSALVLFAMLSGVSPVAAQDFYATATMEHWCPRKVNIANGIATPSPADSLWVHNTAYRFSPKIRATLNFYKVFVYPSATARTYRIDCHYPTGTPGSSPVAVLTRTLQFPRAYSLDRCWPEPLNYRAVCRFKLLCMAVGFDFTGSLAGASAATAAVTNIAPVGARFASCTYAPASALLRFPMTTPTGTCPATSYVRVATRVQTATIPTGIRASADFNIQPTIEGPWTRDAGRTCEFRATTRQSVFMDWR